ncbi:MAG TPA: PQQ-dependent sugar dehydrogenase [Paenibacillaceae bacterium]
MKSMGRKAEKKRRALLLVLAGLALTLVLAACSGQRSGTEPAPTETQAGTAKPPAPAQTEGPAPGGTTETPEPAGGSGAGSGSGTGQPPASPDGGASKPSESSGTASPAPGQEGASQGEEASPGGSSQPQPASPSASPGPSEPPSSSVGPATSEPPKLRLVDAFGGMTFTKPVGLVHADDGSGRLFVVEQPGRIIALSDASDNPERSVFLDIRDKVYDRGWEQGLLGLAFHPDFERNGYFYVNYTTQRTTVIARYQVDPANPDRADPDSELILLEFNQPYPNHNGGQLAFGPDGYLYIATGDGGSGGDPQGNGQNLKTLLGKILRIDVDGRSGNLNYAIPPDNPFAGNRDGYREEIYAYGLRNPWRFSFDPATGWLWAADVGQNAMEEIDIIEKGRNYGWNVMEGSLCFNPRSGCKKDGLTLPIWEYPPLRGSGGASVTGGYVYRGKEIPELVGKYVFADFVDGRMWVLEYDGSGPARATELDIRQPDISSFGVDENGELYACILDGKIMRIVRAD